MLAERPAASDGDVGRAEGKAQVSQVAEEWKALEERAEPGRLCLRLLTLPCRSSHPFDDKASRAG